jgi:hypothetical protein
MTIYRDELLALVEQSALRDFWAVICPSPPSEQWGAAAEGVAVPTVWIARPEELTVEQAMAAVTGHAESIWRWRRAVGLEVLSVPGGVLEKRIVGSTFPVTAVVGTPVVRVRLGPDAGNPRWLAGVAEERRLKGAAIAEAVDALP